MFNLRIRNILGIDSIVPKWEEIQPDNLCQRWCKRERDIAVEKRSFMRAPVTKSEQCRAPKCVAALGSRLT
jgi:hypothetical protein